MVLSFLIYWNGEMVNTPGGIAYDNGCQAPAPLCTEMTIEELKNIIRRRIGLESEIIITEITLRVPHFQGNRLVCYNPYLLTNDNDVGAMIHNFSQVPELTHIELYVKYSRVPTFRNHVSDRVLNLSETENLNEENASESEKSDSEEEEERHYYGPNGEVADDDDGETDSDGNGEVGEGSESHVIRAEDGQAREASNNHDFDYGEYRSTLPPEYLHVNIDDMQVNMGLWPEKDLHWEPGREFEKGMIFASRIVVQKHFLSHQLIPSRLLALIWDHSILFLLHPSRLTPLQQSQSIRPRQRLGHMHHSLVFLIQHFGRSPFQLSLLL